MGERVPLHVRGKHADICPCGKVITAGPSSMPRGSDTHLPQRPNAVGSPETPPKCGAPPPWCADHRTRRHKCWGLPQANVRNAFGRPATAVGQCTAPSIARLSCIALPLLRCRTLHRSTHPCHAAFLFHPLGTCPGPCDDNQTQHAPVSRGSVVKSPSAACLCCEVGKGSHLYILSRSGFQPSISRISFSKSPRHRATLERILRSLAW